MTEPALLHKPVLCLHYCPWWDLAPFPAVSLEQVQPHPWGFWTCKGVEDPKNFKPAHNFTGCTVSFSHDFVDSPSARDCKSHYCRNQGVKLFGLHKCHKISYISTLLSLALTRTNLWMWKYFGVFLIWVMYTVECEFLQQKPVKPSAVLETTVAHRPPNIYHVRMPELPLPYLLSASIGFNF